jgi:hypothetical protein
MPWPHGLPTATANSHAGAESLMDDDPRREEKWREQRKPLRGKGSFPAKFLLHQLMQRASNHQNALTVCKIRFFDRIGGFGGIYRPARYGPGGR